jgi:hypothetical protein
VKVATGHAADAVVLAKQACENSHDSPLMMASYCYALASKGDARQANGVMSKLQAHPHLPGYWLALCHLALNDANAALDTLEQCLKRRCAWRVLMLVDPKLRPLASNARFRAMLHELRFPEAASAGN